MGTADEGPGGNPVAAPFSASQKMPPHMMARASATRSKPCKRPCAARRGRPHDCAHFRRRELRPRRGRAQSSRELKRRSHHDVLHPAADGQPQEETFTIASLTGGQAFAADDPAALREVSRKSTR